MTVTISKLFDDQAAASRAAHRWRETGCARERAQPKTRQPRRPRSRERAGSEGGGGDGSRSRPRPREPVTALAVGGPELAGQAIAAGLVDELELFLIPVLVGGGKRALPDNGVRLDLELVDERRFGNGTAYLRYRLRP